MRERRGRESGHAHLQVLSLYFSQPPLISFLIHSYGRQIPFAALDAARTDFVANQASKAATATPNSLDRAFGPRLAAAAAHAAAHPEASSRVAGLQKQVDEVKSVMVENIEQVLARGERLEALVDKTDDLRSQADRFQVRRKRERRARAFFFILAPSSHAVSLCSLTHTADGRGLAPPHVVEQCQGLGAHRGPGAGVDSGHRAHGLLHQRQKLLQEEAVKRRNEAHRVRGRRLVGPPGRRETGSVGERGGAEREEREGGCGGARPTSRAIC